MFVISFDVFFRVDNSERYSCYKSVGVLGSWFVVFFNRGLVDFDVLGFDDSVDLKVVELVWSFVKYG